jgi:O-antigen ligase
MAMSGSTLAGRLNDMASTGSTDTTRLLLWMNAIHMIKAAPFTGWGLGTYQMVYPVFSKTTLPLVMDKAHNDYLELAAGWGIPAAMLWWGALIWLFCMCLRGVIERRRNRLLPALAVGASILVGIHSLFDFSLQMPAVALTYAAILGLGVAQAFRRHPSEAIPND